jgi:hypothetical protein
LIGWLLVLSSVYFVAVVVYSTTQLAEGVTEFRPWMFGAIIFGGLAYVTGRFGWRMSKKPRTPAVETPNE